MRSAIMCFKTSGQVVHETSIDYLQNVGLCPPKNGFKILTVDVLPSYTLLSTTFVLAFIHRVLRFLTEVNRAVVHIIHSTYKDHDKINLNKLLEGTV